MRSPGCGGSCSTSLFVANWLTKTHKMNLRRNCATGWFANTPRKVDHPKDAEGEVGRPSMQSKRQNLTALQLAGHGFAWANWDKRISVLLIPPPILALMVFQF